MKRNRKKLWFLINWVLMSYCGLTQTATMSHLDRGIIDTTVVRESDNWPGIGDNVSLSADGHYVLYTVVNEPVGSVTLNVEAVDGGWKRAIKGVSGGDITPDSRWLVFRQGDSLCLLRLGGERTFLPQINSYQLMERKKSCLLIYRQRGDVQDLVLREMSNGKEERLRGCVNFWLDTNRKILLWTSKEEVANGILYSLQWMDLTDYKVHLIRRKEAKDALYTTLRPGGEVLYTTVAVQGEDSLFQFHWYSTGTRKERLIGMHRLISDNYQIDRLGQQLLLQIRDTVWYYREGMESMASLISSDISGLEGKYDIGGARFSGDGKQVLFYITAQKKTEQTISAGGAKVAVWHYRDKILPSARTLTFRSEYAHEAVLNLGDRRVLLVDSVGETRFREGNRFIILLNNHGSVFGEDYWQQSAGPEVDLISLKDGGRRRLQVDLRYIDPVIELSPKEDYVVYYDPAHDEYCSYGTVDGKIRKLTKGMGLSWRNQAAYQYFNSPNPFFGVDPSPRGIAGWTEGGNMVLVYDSYDIWKLDPSGMRAPQNMTHGYGRKHRVVFELDGPSKAMIALSGETEWVLNALNTDTKESGYYQKGVGKRPEPLFMGPYDWGTLGKARASDSWVIIRSSALEQGGVYIKQGTRAPTCVRSIGPPSQYNWYVSELVSWELPNGAICQGILYKPKDMDTSRRYPILFNYYQMSSHVPFTFIKPSLAKSTNINVPYFVSRGYLVFMPDIHYQMGHPGESALASIVSAAEYLSKRPYVDSNRMGLAGHSWGGYETNYVVTHSHLFAAAAEGAGPTDFIAGYNGLNGVNGVGFSTQQLYEVSQSRMGVTLWQRPDLYVENSPIMQADKVTTPLLILHNKEDGAVPWSQGVELFTALRRLRKRAWMLQYEGERHSLVKPENILDYTIRLTQFFDHYLKGAPAPKWMTEEATKTENGVDHGLELDGQGRKP